MKDQSSVNEDYIKVLVQNEVKAITAKWQKRAFLALGGNVAIVLGLIGFLWSAPGRAVENATERAEQVAAEAARSRVEDSIGPLVNVAAGRVEEFLKDADVLRATQSEIRQQLDELTNRAGDAESELVTLESNLTGIGDAFAQWSTDENTALIEAARILAKFGELKWKLLESSEFKKQLNEFDSQLSNL